MNTKDLIQSIVSGDTGEAGHILNTLLKNKVKDEIDFKRISVANKIFNQGESDLEESTIQSEEIEEGNEFTKAAAKAVLAGEEEFEFDGKTYPATLDLEIAKKILGIKDEE